MANQVQLQAPVQRQSADRSERLTARLQRWADRNFHYLLIVPLVVALLALVAFPLGYGLYYSFTNYRLLSTAATEWVGLRNYERTLDNPAFRSAVKHTAVFGFWAIGIEMIVAMVIALLLSRQVRGIGIARTLYLIPYMVGGVLVGFQYRWFFNDQFGFANNILLELHIIDRPIAWLVRYPMESVIAASVWHTAPFTAMLLLAGLLAVPNDLYEAASVDGASTIRKFRDVTFPFILPLFLLVLTMRLLSVPPVFDHIWVMTQGGPAMKTDVVMSYVFRTAIEKGNFGLGSSAAYLILLGQLVLLLVQMRVIQRIRRGM
jgi:multiple sugar transport system permease protein